MTTDGGSAPGIARWCRSGRLAVRLASLRTDWEADMLTSSASEAAAIFRITLPRWALTVISEIPRSAAICLFSKPATTSSSTSRSRGAQRCMAIVEDAHRRLLSQRMTAAIQGAAHGAQDRRGADGLGQKINGTRLHGAHRHADIAMIRHEDDGRLLAVREDFLKRESVELRQGNLRDETAGPHRSRASQEFLRRSEGFCLPARRADQQLQRYSHRPIVVDDRDERRMFVQSCAFMRVISQKWPATIAAPSLHARNAARHGMRESCSNPFGRLRDRSDGALP